MKPASPLHFDAAEEALRIYEERGAESAFVFLCGVCRLCYPEPGDEAWQWAQDRVAEIEASRGTPHD